MPQKSFAVDLRPDREVSPVLSIIVPVYNTDIELLKSCLSSLTEQSLRPSSFEILIVDDASTDKGTRETLLTFLASEANARLVTHQRNKGLNAARRSGFLASEGEFLLFVDSDDRLTGDGAEALLLEARRSGADLVTAPMRLWNRQHHSWKRFTLTETPFPPDRKQRLRSMMEIKHSFTMCGRLFKRSLFDEGVFDLPEHILHEDMVTTPRVVMRADRVVHYPNFVYLYTVNDNSITGSFNRRHVLDQFAAFYSWLELADEAGLCNSALSILPRTVHNMSENLARRARFSAPSAEEARKATSLLRDLYELFPISLPAPTSPNLKAALEATDKPYAKYSDGPSPRADKTFARVLRPGDIARRTAGAVLFVAQVDYQARAAAHFARRLNSLGIRAAILDNSAIASGGQRRLGKQERASLDDLDIIEADQNPLPADAFATAALLVTFNDFNAEIRDALEYRRLCGLRSACMIEGINDFDRVDFDEPRFLPYRRCETVLLAGDDDAQYFKDRETKVIGMPMIERQFAIEPLFPLVTKAVLNLNFTYGSLEDSRRPFLLAAQEGFDAAGVDWVVSQHPMDTGEVPAERRSSLTQYELIDQGSVFVSRFATGILEALAAGKPVIYFNPHHEKVPKFKDPMGAFQIACDAEQLRDALRQVEADIQAGVDVRRRAATFLRHHCAVDVTSRGEDAADRLAEFVLTVLKAERRVFGRIRREIDRAEIATLFESAGVPA